jgi:hypothetical protein
MTAICFLQAVEVFSVSSVRCPESPIKESITFAVRPKKQVRNDVVFRRASLSRLVIRGERVNSLHLARRSAPLHVKRFQKSVSAVLHLALSKLDRHGEQRNGL